MDAANGRVRARADERPERAGALANTLESNDTLLYFGDDNARGVGRFPSRCVAMRSKEDE